MIRLLRAFVLAWLTAAPAGAVVLFQLETFDSPHNWDAGNPHPNPPSIIADSGPLGTGDSSLRITAAPGSGPGSRLAAYNRVDWTGDYLGAGVSALTMDLQNQSFLTSSVRVAVNGPGGWFVTEAEELGIFSTWNSVTFTLTAETLFGVEGATDVAATLGNVTELRILHNPDLGFRGGQGQRTLLVDNIQAVPEASTLLLVVLGSGFLVCRKR